MLDHILQFTPFELLYIYVYQMTYNHKKNIYR